MIKHFVAFTFGENVSDEQAESVLNAVGQLKATIPFVKSFEWGKNNSEEKLNKGFTHGFEMTFASLEDRDKYLTHPNHVAFVNNILQPVLQNGKDSIFVFDYTVD